MADLSAVAFAKAEGVTRHVKRTADYATPISLAGFCADLKSGQDIFELRGIDRDAGCMVVVRPDQHIAQVPPIDGYEKLAAHFDGFMLKRSEGGARRGNRHTSYTLLWTTHALLLVLGNKFIESHIMLGRSSFQEELRQWILSMKSAVDRHIWTADFAVFLTKSSDPVK